MVCNRFDRILEILWGSIGKGRDVVNYICNIDESLYARHVFPLPHCGKIYSNHAQQANLGLLPI